MRKDELGLGGSKREALGKEIGLKGRLVKYCGEQE